MNIQPKSFLTKEFARCFVIPIPVIIVVVRRYLSRTQRGTRGAGPRTAADHGRRKNEEVDSDDRGFFTDCLVGGNSS
jgi:hypothetical protein